MKRPLSFEIAQTQRQRLGVPNKAPRLDQVNSAGLIQRARQIYGLHLNRSGFGQGRPAGVILQGDGGRVVFSLPTLLPEEVFVPAEWLLGGSGSVTTRPPRQRLGTPWSTQQH